MGRGRGKEGEMGFYGYVGVGADQKVTCLALERSCSCFKCEL